METEVRQQQQQGMSSLERTKGQSDDPDTGQHNIDVDELLCHRPRRRLCIPLVEAPEFIKRLNAFEEVTAGDSVTFQCKWRSFPKATIKWYKDDVEITEDERYVVNSDPNMPCQIQLTLKDTMKEDEGAYKCKAENSEGVASTTGYLSVSGGRTLASKKKQKLKDKKQQREEKRKQMKKESKQGKEEENNSSTEPADAKLRKVQSDRTVSYPPHLRTIVEQKSMEEREAESLMHQPPSPIQDFIERIQSDRGRGAATWPYNLMGCGDREKDDDTQSTGSDNSADSQDFDRITFDVTCDDDVFQNGVEYSDPLYQPNHCQLLTANYRAKSKTPSPPRSAHGDSDTESIPSRRNSTKLPPRLNIAEAFDNFMNTSWLYFLPLTTSVTFIALATEMSPEMVVLIVFCISLVMFRCLFSDFEEEP